MSVNFDKMSDFSITGMKWSGSMTIPLGWCHRISASTPRI